MFDDPQKELKQLEEQLLENEMEEEAFEQFYHEIFEEFGPGNEEDPRAVAPKSKTGAYKDTPRAVAPKKKKKGVRGLVLLICVELLGIACVVLWWLQRLL